MVGILILLSVFSYMGRFPLWIRHGDQFKGNMNYIGGKLAGKAIESDVGYDRFVEIVGSFVKINGSRSQIIMKFDPKMEDMSEWYDIDDNDSLSLFLCYDVRNSKKYKLFVSVLDKVDVARLRGEVMNWSRTML